MITRRVKKGTEGAIYCGRPSRWGNSFVIGRDGNRKTVVQKHRALVQSWPDKMKQVAKRALGGKELTCWCKLSEACHVDNLVDLCEGRL